MKKKNLIKISGFFTNFFSFLSLFETFLYFYFGFGE